MKFKNKVTGTDPLILHINGSNRVISQDPKFHNPIIDSSPIIKPNELTIITCATKEPDIINKSPLLKQLNKYGVDYVNIGEYHKESETPWKNLFKLYYLQKYIEEVGISTPFVCFLDASDILLSEDFHLILDKFSKLKLDLLWDAQIFNYPCEHPSLLTTPTTDLEKSRVKYSNKFLCSGVCTGKSSTFEKFIKITVNNIDLEDNRWGSDQREVRKTFDIYYKEFNTDYDYSSHISLSPGEFFKHNKLIYEIKDNFLVFSKTLI